MTDQCKPPVGWIAYGFIVHCASPDVTGRIREIADEYFREKEIVNSEAFMIPDEINGYGPGALFVGRFIGQFTSVFRPSEVFVGQSFDRAICDLCHRVLSEMPRTELVGGAKNKVSKYFFPAHELVRPKDPDRLNNTF